MTTKKPNPFRRFTKTQTKLYPRVWCDSCHGDNWCPVEDHKVGVCAVCGERGSNAHVHEPGIPADVLLARLKEFHSWRFEVAKDEHGGILVTKADRHSYVSGDLVIEGVRHLCIGQQTTGEQSRYGPAGLVTKAISNGAKRHGLLPANFKTEEPGTLQELAGATTDINHPEPPTKQAPLQLSVIAMGIVDDYELTKTAIRAWAKRNTPTVKLGNSPGAMLMLITGHLAGDGYDDTNLDNVADHIADDADWSDEEE